MILHLNNAVKNNKQKKGFNDVTEKTVKII